VRATNSAFWLCPCRDGSPSSFYVGSGLDRTSGKHGQAEQGYGAPGPTPPPTSPVAAGPLVSPPRPEPGTAADRPPKETPPALPRIVASKQGLPWKARGSVCWRNGGEWLEIMGHCLFQALRHGPVAGDVRLGRDLCMAERRPPWRRASFSVHADGFAPHEEAFSLPPKVRAATTRLARAESSTRQDWEGRGSRSSPTAAMRGYRIVETDARGEALFRDLKPDSYTVLIGDPEVQA